MATTYKSLSTNDIVTTKTLLHEAIPITGTIASGSYNDGSTPKVEQNIKNYTHGQFQSVYDYPYLSSSANHIFDISVGLAPAIGTLTGSALSGTTSGHKEISKKVNMYNQMAQVLMGYDESGNIQMFDEDGDIASGGNKLQEVVFMNFARLLTKDEIKKGTFNIELGVTAEHNLNGTAMTTTRIKLSDSNAQNDYRVNSPAGDYGILYAAKSAGTNVLSDSTANGTAGATTVKAGLLFYQAGVAVISSNVFKSDHAHVTIKATGAPTAGGTIKIIAADGTHTTFTAHASSTSGTQFAINDSKNGLTNLKARIEADSTIGSKVTVSTVQTVTGGFMITIMQNTAGTTGNTTITNALTTYSVAGGANDADGAFSGGGGGGFLAKEASITQMDAGLQNVDQLFVSGAVSASCDALRQRVHNLQFNNTTELNSTVYFCRAHHNEFNYSTNPTYLSSSQIYVKNDHSDSPISYITTVGLYSADNELLAVAKLSEPLKKDPTNELTLRVRLDY